MLELRPGVDAEAASSEEGLVEWLKAAAKRSPCALVMFEGYGRSGSWINIKAKTPKLFVHGGGYHWGGTNTSGYYAVDPGCALYNGKPRYKKVQANGSFCTPGRAPDGSQRLEWRSDGYWCFAGFGGSSNRHGIGKDSPYKNRVDTPQPPHAGWEKRNYYGTAPYPTVTML